MAITINGNGTITGISVGGLPNGIVDTDTLANNATTGAKLASGAIIQTVIGASDTSTGSALTITSSNSSAPDFLNSGSKVTITPQFSNSKILLVWTAGIRLDPDAEGYVGVYYSPNSDMSSPVIIDPQRGASRDESFRNNDGSGDAHIFWVQSQSTWDTTVTNTNTRYYNVGAYLSNNDAIQYGDGQVGLTLMAQEIKT